MKSVRKYGLGVLLIFLLATCKVERPDHILSDELMEEVLFDYHIAKAMGENLDYRDNYKRTLYLDAVFDKHHITEAQFDSTMAWYARHPEVINEVYEVVRERLKAERDNYDNLVAMRDGKPKKSKEGDSIDLWIWNRIHLITGMPLDNKLTFTLPSDDNFMDTDTLQWTVGVRFLNEPPADTLRRPVMAMQVAYSKDTVISSLCRIDSSMLAKLTLHADTLGSIKEVSGFIYYPSNQAKKVLVIDSISLMRYHAGDSIVSTKPVATTTENKVEKAVALPKQEKPAMQPAELKIDKPLKR